MPSGKPTTRSCSDALPKEKRHNRRLLLYKIFFNGLFCSFYFQMHVHMLHMFGRILHTRRDFVLSGSETHNSELFQMPSPKKRDITEGSCCTFNFMNGLFCSFYDIHMLQMFGILHTRRDFVPSGSVTHNPGVQITSPKKRDITEGSCCTKYFLMVYVHSISRCIHMLHISAGFYTQDEISCYLK